MYTNIDIELIAKKLTYVFNMKEYFTYLKKLGVENWKEVGVWLIKNMLNYNGIITSDFYPNHYQDICKKYFINIDTERMRLYKSIFLYLSNKQHYTDTYSYIEYNNGNIIITFKSKD